MSSAKKSMLNPMLQADDDSDDDDDELGEIPKLDALRNSKKLDAFYGDNGLFDVLAFWSSQLDIQPVHALMAQRVFIDLPSESISETVFSIHENFASDLRQSLRSKYISFFWRFAHAWALEVRGLECEVR